MAELEKAFDESEQRRFKAEKAKETLQELTKPATITASQSKLADLVGELSNFKQLPIPQEVYVLDSKYVSALTEILQGISEGYANTLKESLDRLEQARGQNLFYLEESVKQIRSIKEAFDDQVKFFVDAMNEIKRLMQANVELEHELLIQLKNELL